MWSVSEGNQLNTTLVKQILLRIYRTKLVLRYNYIYPTFLLNFPSFTSFQLYFLQLPWSDMTCTLVQDVWIFRHSSVCRLVCTARLPTTPPPQLCRPKLEEIDLAAAQPARLSTRAASNAEESSSSASSLPRSGLYNCDCAS